MKIEWHRPHETVMVEKENNPYFCTRRPYYYSIPVLHESLAYYLDYPYSNEMAVSLVIAKRNDAHYPELLIKRACWMVKNLCERTDMREEQVRLGLSVDKALEEIAMPYFDACQFPSDRINWFDSLESSAPGVCKFEALQNDIFTDVERIIHLDLSLLVGKHPTQRILPLFYRFKEKWNTEIFACVGNLLRDRMGNVINAKNRLDWNDARQKQFADFTHCSVQEENDYWDYADPLYFISGAIMGFHRTLLDDTSFWADVLHIQRIAGDDEIAMCTYARREGWQQDDVANFFGCFNWSGDKVLPSGHYEECPIIIAYPEISFQFWLSQHIQYENIR